MSLMARLRRYLLRDHEREHAAVNKELNDLRAELEELERQARLRRLEVAIALRARRHRGAS